MNEMTTEIAEMENVKSLCQSLMNTPHYKRLGHEGIFAVVEKAKSIGVSTIDALNGGLYFVQGKVEMTSALMNQLIRQAGHSVTKDKKSDNTICILHGKRKDTGDTWTEYFSIEEAQLAGIYKGAWIKYPRDMLFARALSRLARQLFPDVIKGCYVQGEISDAPPLDAPIDIKQAPAKQPQIEYDCVSREQANELLELLKDDKEYAVRVYDFINSKFGASSLHDMPLHIFEKILPIAKQKSAEAQKKNREENFEVING